MTWCSLRLAAFERRFETPPGRQAQVDFAGFKVAFTDEPGITRKVWLFAMVLGHSRWLWGRFVASQDLQTVLRSHIAAFDAMGGAPAEVLYDRMKTAVIGEDADGIVTYNASLVALLGHYGTVPKACRPYRASTARIVDEAFTEEQPALKPLPAIPNNAVLTIERRVSLIIMELGA